MKTLGEAALQLPWLAPSATSLTTLARFPLSSAWPQLRTDPGLVLLLARSSADSLLETAVQFLPHANVGFVDWNQPNAHKAYRAAYQHALLTERLTKKPDERAWIAGFLAPLGWMASAVVGSDGLDSQTSTALARRLARTWRLPSWLTAIVGQLGLHATIAERLGADRTLFQTVQLAAMLLDERDAGLELPVGTTLVELLSSLRLSVHDVNAAADEVVAATVPTQAWVSPAAQPLLADFLHLAIDQRRRDDAGWIDRLQHDVDRLQEALVAQCADDEQRLHAMKLSSLAEFAAGAGHEINNPLAVISGQAQYILKQMDLLAGPADEIENVAEYLDHLRGTVTPSLQKIIGQTQRIHSILKELMQFARPGTPKLQSISAAELVRDAADALRSFAQEHQVELDCAASADIWLHADPTQARTALTGLLKNAIEAAPAGGWARVRASNDRPGLLDLVVEDNGKGPPPALREHLFDPFYSGRSAGRGRGMGLPTAWRLARQQDGDVRFDGADQGVTRFVMTLPMATAPAASHEYALARSV